MIIGTCVVYMRAEWVSSLKEKRMIVKSITERAKNKFNISIAEVASQDAHNDITIGFACVTNEHVHADSMVQNVVRFIESHTEAVINDIVIEIL